MIIVVCLGLSGCGDNIPVWQIKNAEKSCADHLGLSSIDADTPFVYGTAHCLDGSRHRIDIPPK